MLDESKEFSELKEELKNKFAESSKFFNNSSSMAISFEGKKLSYEEEREILDMISENTELGKCVTIDHSNGIVIKYCGFDTLAVAKGEGVTTGRVIGTVGTVTSECADESHIHIEAQKDNKSVSPLKILGLE